MLSIRDKTRKLPAATQIAFTWIIRRAGKIVARHSLLTAPSIRTARYTFTARTPGRYVLTASVTAIVLSGITATTRPSTEQDTPIPLLNHSAGPRKRYERGESTMGLQRVRNLSRGGWLAAGIVLALVLAPSAAIAAATAVTEITGPGGHRAAVTNAGRPHHDAGLTGQLRSQGRQRRHDPDFTRACLDLAPFSATAGFVITQITVSVTSDPNPGTGDLALYEGPGCQANGAIASLTPPALGMTVLPVGPGLAIPRNGTFWFAVQDMGALVTVYGYKVPASEISGYTPNH